MTTDRLFLDTAYVLGLVNSRDRYHQAARALSGRVRAAGEVWVTEAVLAEVGNILARSSRLAAAAFIRGCYTTPNVRVVPIDTAFFLRATDLYASRPDRRGA